MDVVYQTDLIHSNFTAIDGQENLCVFMTEKQASFKTASGGAAATELDIQIRSVEFASPLPADLYTEKIEIK